MLDHSSVVAHVGVLLFVSFLLCWLLFCQCCYLRGSLIGCVKVSSCVCTHHLPNLKCVFSFVQGLMRVVWLLRSLQGWVLFALFAQWMVYLIRFFSLAETGSFHFTLTLISSYEWTIRHTISVLFHLWHHQLFFFYYSLKHIIKVVFTLWNQVSDVPLLSLSSILQMRPCI